MTFLLTPPQLGDVFKDIGFPSKDNSYGANLASSSLATVIGPKFAMSLTVAQDTARKIMETWVRTMFAANLY